MLEVDSGLIEDLLELLSSSGVEKRFLKRLEKYLQQLREDGEKAIGKKGDPMEHLGGSSSLCSMRFPLGVSNIRILFAYRNNEIIKYTCFVHFMSVKDIKIQNMMHISRWLKSA